MTAEASAWIPPGAVSPHTGQAIAQLIAIWSQQWVERGRFRPVGTLTRIGDARWANGAAEWRTLACGLAIGVPEGGAASIGTAMLALGRDGRTDADRALLDQLGETALSDLQDRLAAWLRPGGGGAWTHTETPRHRDGPIHALEVEGPSEGTRLRIELTEALFARQLKAALPPPPSHGPLGNGQAALAALPVTLSAALGRCTLTLADLRGLEPGDVLVLDTASDAPLPIAIDGSPARRGSCAVAGDDTALSLRILQPISGY